MEDAVGYGNPPKNTQFQLGHDQSPGRKKGSKNRSTVARKILDMVAKVPDAQLAKLKQLFPELPDDLTVEEVLTLAQAGRAISKSDYNSYKVLMDSGYGAPKQQHEHTGEDGGPITYFELPKKQ